MFDREQFKKEIEAQLKDMPKDKRVAFAVRSAMRVRVLPALAFDKKNREAFWYWRAEDRNKHLLAVLRAYGIGLEFVVTKERPSGAVVYDY